MQTLKQARLLTRLLIFLLVVASLVLISWLLAYPRFPAASPALAKLYFMGAMDNRTGPSTEGLIEDLQVRLRADDRDWQAYSQLGVAYLQKARETGDPTYYQKAEKALDQALA